jgi:fructosamine-3-kinase
VLRPSDRRALERLCSRLPGLLPPAPPVLTHGDLWAGNVLATANGSPALVDPAICYSIAEMDLSMLWCARRPAGVERCFAAYQEILPLETGWRHRMRILYLRELLCTLAHAGDVEGAANAVREILAPFQTTSNPTTRSRSASAFHSR